MRKKTYFLLTALCTAVYFVGYLTRYDLAVSLTEMAQSLQVPQRSIALAVTGIFITYGIGQVGSGLLGDHFSPHILIGIGLGGTAICNAIVAGTQSVTLIVAAWWINGFFQALLWPPMVRALAEHLDATQYRQAVLSVSVGGNMATVLIYIIAPLCIRASGWQLTFTICAAAAGVIFLLWIIFAGKLLKSPSNPAIENNPTRNNNSGSAAYHPPFSTVALVLIFFAIISQGMLRDGVQTWVPAYIADQFHLAPSSAILSGTILPIFSVLSLFAAAQLSRRVPQEMSAAAICFAIGAVSTAALLFLPGSILVNLLEMACLCGAMHGVNFILTTRVPARFSNSGRVSAISGALNSATYVGSALSTYGIALISDQFGWPATIISWLFITLIGMICCLFARRAHN